MAHLVEGSFGPARIANVNGHGKDPRVSPAARDNASLTLTIPQAAVCLGISTSAAYEFARRGDLPTVKLGARVLVSRKMLEAMIDGRWTPNNQDR
jgi:excisionase family DNA binding protein